MAAETSSTRPASHRPRITTVFVAAFVAGAAAAVGVNRALDLHLAQAKPQVECEPVFVALRPLPSGAPITVWDVALRDLPKAMVPATALRVTDSFEGRILKFPLREGQPLMSGQLVQPEPAPPATVEGPAAESPVREEPVEEAFVAPVPAQPSVATTTVEPVAEPLAVVPNQATADPAPSVGQSAEERVGVVVKDPIGDESAGNVPQTAPQPVASPAANVAANVAADPPVPVAEPNPAAAPTHTVDGRSAGEPVAAVAPTVPTPSEEPSPTDVDGELDMPARPPVDVSKLPSVMASDGPTAAPEETSGRPGVRYLVVPERIARQADTSFTTPPAPSAAVDAPVEPQPSPATRQPSAESPKAQTQTAQPQKVQVPKSQPRRTPQAQAQPGPSSNRQSQQLQARSRPTNPRTTTPAKPSEQPAADGSPGPRAWGGMFPNVSAGLEAFGGWRSGRTAPGQSASGSTTR